MLDRERSVSSSQRDRRRTTEPSAAARKAGTADDMDAAQLKGFFEGLLSSKGTSRTSRRRVRVGTVGAWVAVRQPALTDGV